MVMISGLAGERAPVPVSELLVDRESGFGQERGEGLPIEEAKGAAACLRTAPSIARIRRGEADDIGGHRHLNLVFGAHDGAGGVNEVRAVLRSPPFPRASQGVTGFECESTTAGKRRVDGRKRGLDLPISDEDLECVARHNNQVEVPVPLRRGRIAEHPLDVRPSPRHPQHPLGGVKADEAAGMPLLASPVQQRPGPASHVEDVAAGHDQGQVETKVVAALPAMEGVVEGGEVGLGKLPVRHFRRPYASMPRSRRAFRSASSVSMRACTHLWNICPPPSLRPKREWSLAPVLRARCTRRPV